MKKAFLFRKFKNNIVECTACSHYCKIPEGRTGICGVRKNEKGKLYLLVYGKAATVNIDPMEKKPLFHFLPGSKIFSFGTIGCNLGCEFCQNWDISQASRTIKQQYSDPQQQLVRLGEITAYGQNLPPEEIVNYCIEKNIPSIAYTYNEPVIFFEYIYDTARLAHKNGIRNVFVSNGYESKEAIKKIRPYLDGINIDLKAFTNEFYLKMCKAKLEPVLENIKRVFREGMWMEITTLIILGENDSDKELKQIAGFISSVSKAIPWHVTAFHPDYKMLDKSFTPMQTLQKAYKIGKAAGLKYVYMGNVFGGEESTYCPECNELLIYRNSYHVEIKNFVNGSCGKCGEKIEGVWR